MAITVYRVRVDRDQYRYFEPEDGDVSLFDFDGSPLLDNWSPIEMELANPKKKKPDFYGVAMSMTALGIEWDLFKKISQFFEQSGEILPVKVDGKESLVYNCTDVLNCLDKKRSDPDSRKYVFNPKKFNYSLFKLAQTPMQELLTVEGFTNPEDEFKPVVERMGLIGLRFVKLWSDAD